MTDHELEIVTLIYALGDFIKMKDWVNAQTAWERLLLAYSPIGEWHPLVGTALEQNAAVTHLAERQSTKIH